MAASSQPQPPRQSGAGKGLPPRRREDNQTGHDECTTGDGGTDNMRFGTASMSPAGGGRVAASWLRGRYGAVV